MENDDLICCICNEIIVLKDRVTVTRKGLNTLLNASKRRNDNKHVYFESGNSVTFHASCRKSYTSERTIIADLKRTAIQDETENDENTPLKKRLKKEAVTALKDRCLFCAQEITEVFLWLEKKKPKNRRTEVSKVTSIPMRNTLLRKADERKDTWGRQVKSRIINVSDLVAAGAMYHRTCYQMFLRGNPFEAGIVKFGRPPDEHVTDAMNKIFQFIENSNECQFTLSGVVNQLEGYRPSPKTVKQKLFEKYGHNITFSKFPGQKMVFYVRESSEIILTDHWYQSRKTNVEEEKLRIIETAAAIIRSDISSKVRDTAAYPSPENFNKSAPTIVPESLKVFLKGLECSIICGNCHGTTYCLNASETNFFKEEQAVDDDLDTPDQGTEMDCSTVPEIKTLEMDNAIPSTSGVVKSLPIL